ncbi:MAG TPA: xanthine dehydrogenase family protein molybdopterin-binding subunit [Vineibacter sp.]|nr:xanthine dehydrogenase family protein molybdopterin-binding subunit [Vineibacter sp.]
MTDMTVVGQSAPRLEGHEKITGRTVYVDDMQRSGMLHAAVLRSPYAHARLVSVDVTAARALPGVHGVLTGADFPHRYGAFVQDEVALAQGKVRYVGEPVAVVAADTLALARQALGLIAIDYQELPAVMTPVEALAPDAPLVHDDFAAYGRRVAVPLPANVCAATTIAEGDVEAAFAGCDVVIEGTYETQAQVHCYLEPCGALAEADAAGKVTVWSSCQSVFRVQATVAEVLGMPMSRVRAIATRVGGAFGGKSDVTVQPLAALLAVRTRRPVKLVLSRDDDFMMMRTRHPATIWMKTGAMADGRLVARAARVTLDGGAYAEDSSAVLGFALLIARGPYRIDHIRMEGQVAYTNRLRAAGFRGYGNPQVTFAGECQVDEIAARLGRDPIDLRLQNAVRAGDRWVGGQAIEACGFAECLEKLRDALPPRMPGRGIGVACVTHISGILSTSAIVRVLEDGTVTLNTGAVDLGEGADTVLAQICAETLKIPLDRINYTVPDTDGSPYNWSTGGSRVTYMVGRAVAGAAGQARDRLFQHAAEMLECATGDLELRVGGRVGIVGVPGAEVPFRDISGRAHWVAGGPIIGTTSVMFEGGGFDPKRSAVTGNGIGKLGTFVFGAQAAEVEVDDVTGQIAVRRIWAAHDVGRAINPTAVEGQIAGGIVQGLGYALYEDLRFDGSNPANPTLMDYKVPGALDVPEITPIIVEHPEPSGPFGAKGIGEPPLVPVAPAIANAVADARGVRMRALPMTPERVLAALDGGSIKPSSRA